MKPSKLIAPFRITKAADFRIDEFDTADTRGIQDKDDARQLLEESTLRLATLQEKLYAQDKFALLLIFQAMDAAGKDSTIKHVMSGVNPQGCQVYSFKAPSSEELDHDFLWRTNRCLPERGRIGIFNRSYYEEVLVTRVHPEYLVAQRLSDKPDKEFWQHRYDAIVASEDHLTRAGTMILKFFLHVSKKEQKARFLARLDEPDKNWKFSPADVAERAHWNDYMHAYEQMIRHTSTKKNPWHVIPVDHKWFARVAVSWTIVEALESLDLAFPTVDAARKKQLAAARKMLEAE